MPNFGVLNAKSVLYKFLKVKRHFWHSFKCHNLAFKMLVFSVYEIDPCWKMNLLELLYNGKEQKSCQELFLGAFE